jgi:hypothetical protein
MPKESKEFATSEEKLTPLDKILFSLATFLLLAWLCFWIFTMQPDRDSVQHYHVAWLMHQGLMPFRDFFEHHSPIFWGLLSLYFKFIGDNYGIIIVSRLVMLAIFALISFLTYRLARNWTGPAGAMIAALGFPIFCFLYSLAYIEVRADPLILLLLVTSLWLAAPLVDRSPWGKGEIKCLMKIFATLGLALAFSPRAGIPALTLYLILAWFAQRELPLKRLFVTFLLGAGLIILPLMLVAWYYDPARYFFWVFYYSSHFTPRFSPLEALIDQLFFGFPLWFLAAWATISLLHRRPVPARRSVQMIAVMAVAGMAGLWACPLPYMQQFLMALPLIGLLAGMGYEHISRNIRRLFVHFSNGWAGLFLILPFLILPHRAQEYIRVHKIESLSAWVQRSNWFRANIPSEEGIAAGIPINHPIFFRDSFYYWSVSFSLRTTLERVRSDFKLYTLDDLQRNSPAVLHQSFADYFSLSQSSQFQDWIRRNYHTCRYPGYWLRNDSTTN